MSQRGHAEPEAFYQRLHDAVGVEERVIEELSRELDHALSEAGRLQSDLSAILPLVHVVSPDSAVQEAVHQLCHACAAVLADSTALRTVLRARAYAAEHRDRRALGR